MPFRKLLNSLAQELQSGLQGAGGGSGGNGYGFGGGYGGFGGITCALVPSEYYDDPRTMAILQQIAACAVTSGFMRRPDMSALVNWLRANLPPPRGPGVGGASQGIPGGLGGAPPLPKGLCPRDYPSTTLRCRTMQGLFDFTVCEQCYKEVVEGDFNRGIGLAVRLGGAPAAAVGGAGFTCQLYSERMRRVWKEAVNMDEPMGFEHLRVKVNERKAKEREL
ncbi:hypothetical protein B0T20DRAFT_364634 [Sordaria brevicollis]|uniref:Uncharacterized protein n=1 Tax=Sordaria brevicollis TaxID=83679 RepID=A0AAE0NVE4_SORBR|nr:hypothetical protein B0T20DRAFT_364634 [Sordaria brevicollis]